MLTEDLMAGDAVPDLDIVGLYRSPWTLESSVQN